MKYILAKMYINSDNYYLRRKKSKRDFILSNQLFHYDRVAIRGDIELNGSQTIASLARKYNVNQATLKDFLNREGLR